MKMENLLKLKNINRGRRNKIPPNDTFGYCGMNYVGGVLQIESFHISLIQ